MTDPTINDLASRFDDLNDQEIPEVAPVPKQIGRPFGKGAMNPRDKQVRVDGFNTMPRAQRGGSFGPVVVTPVAPEWMRKPLRPPMKGIR